MMSQILVRNLSAGDNVRTSGIRSIIRWLQKTLGLRKTNAVYLALRVRPTSAVWAFLPGSDQKQRVASIQKPCGQLARRDSSRRCRHRIRRFTQRLESDRTHPEKVSLA